MYPCPPRAWRWAEVCPGFKRAEDRFYGAHNRAGITYAPSPTRGRGEMKPKPHRRLPKVIEEAS